MTTSERAHFANAFTPDGRGLFYVEIADGPNLMLLRLEDGLETETFLSTPFTPSSCLLIHHCAHLLQILWRHLLSDEIRHGLDQPWR